MTDILLIFCCTYIDWLVTTFNEELPDEQWRIPQPHPSSVKPSAVEDADYHRLVNSVERHTRCSSAYCLRQKNLSVPVDCQRVDCQRGDYIAT